MNSYSRSWKKNEKRKKVLRPLLGKKKTFSLNNVKFNISLIWNNFFILVVFFNDILFLVSICYQLYTSKILYYSSLGIFSFYFHFFVSLKKILTFYFFSFLSSNLFTCVCVCMCVCMYVWKCLYRGFYLEIYMYR